MRACIAIIDSTRARICEYDERNAPGEELHEVSDKLNPGRRHIGEMFEQAQSGERTGSSAAHQQATDDHREGYVDVRDQKFAREVIEEIDRIVRGGAFTHVVVIAAPRTLGELRKYDSVLRRDGLKLEEIERDLGGLSDPQLHDHLAHAGILPSRKRIAAAR
jgi:protein required for attachment to host cells